MDTTQGSAIIQQAINSSIASKGGKGWEAEKPSQRGKSGHFVDGGSGTSLWKLKTDNPELFAHKDQKGAAPPGFEATDVPGISFHKSRKAFFLYPPGKLLWFDEGAQMHRDLHEGQSLPVAVVGAGSSATPDESTQPYKHVVITDLHKVAEMLKLDLDHLDRPAAMLGVFGSSGSNQAETAAKGYYDKLIRRLGAFRGVWTDDALCAAMTSALDDVMVVTSDESETQATQPAAVALVVGRRVAAMATTGASYCVFARPSDGSEPRAVRTSASASASTRASPQNGPESSCLEMDPAEDFYITLLVGESKISIPDTLLAVSRHLLNGRPRAASISLLHACDNGQATGPLAAACARLTPASAPLEVQLPPEKRQKTTTGAGVGADHVVRARHILVRFAAKGMKDDQLMDPVRRKKVTRSLEKAEKTMHEVLKSFDGEEGAVDFDKVCRKVSECPSALKGGEMAGDVGWVDLAKGATMLQENSVPASVVKALVERRVGELTDLVVSNIGVHLLQRIA